MKITALTRSLALVLLLALGVQQTSFAIAEELSQEPIEDEDYYLDSFVISAYYSPPSRPGPLCDG